MAREGLFKSMGTGYDDLQNQMYAQDQASVQKARFGSIPDYISRNVRQGELALQGGLEQGAGMLGIETPRGKQLAKAAKIDNDRKIMMEKYKDASKDGKITEAEYDSLAADFASMGYGNAADTVMKMKRAEYGSKLEQRKLDVEETYKKGLVSAKEKAAIAKERKRILDLIPKMNDENVKAVKDFVSGGGSRWLGHTSTWLGDSELGDALQKRFNFNGEPNKEEAARITQAAILYMQKNEKPMYLPDAIKEMMSVYKKPKGNTGKIKTGDRFGHVGRARPKN
tara:strand:+ start:831 stop:1676 length:846 start_codon:yes stop_codon:yes gene_type:complete